MMYIDEVKGMLRLFVQCLAAVEDLLLWRKDKMLFSAALCIGFQALVSAPHYLPAACCLLWLGFLLHSYSMPPNVAILDDGEDGRLEAKIHSRTTFRDHLLALILNRKFAPLVIEPRRRLSGSGRPRSPNGRKSPNGRMSPSGRKSPSVSPTDNCLLYTSPSPRDRG